MIDSRKSVELASAALLEKIENEKNLFETITSNQGYFDGFGVSEFTIRYWLVPFLYQQGFREFEREKRYSGESLRRGKGGRSSCDVFAKNESTELWLEIKYISWDTEWTSKEVEKDVLKLDKEKGSTKLKVLMCICEANPNGGETRWKKIMSKLGLTQVGSTKSYSIWLRWVGDTD